MATVDPARAVYCNRTLNLRSIRAIGYDMDYTLVHYRHETWERTAFQHLRAKLVAMGWPVEKTEFDPTLVVRGLLIDCYRGNVVKANRFGYIKSAYHGMRPLEFEEQKRTYSEVLVDLNDRHWVFLNTLFSISEACMYMQLVDLYDRGVLRGVLAYDDLYRRVRQSLDEAHMEGELKAEILANPDRYVERDPEVPLALLDQKEAGKHIMLITNSGWEYTHAMMSYAFNDLMPRGASWRELFDLVIVGSSKPRFFTHHQPMLEVTSDAGDLRPMHRPLSHPGVYWGGSADQVERYLNANGSQVLYVGDHVYGDVHQSKNVRRWRTGLILRELEEELRALGAFHERQAMLNHLMNDKTAVELDYSLAKLAIQRLRAGYGPPESRTIPELEAQITGYRAKLAEIDPRIAALARASSELYNPRWGLIMRTGNDKSHMARQIERHADIYTSRVSNFLYETPFAYYRSPRGSLPHDAAC